MPIDLVTIPDLAQERLIILRGAPLACREDTDNLANWTLTRRRQRCFGERDRPIVVLDEGNFVARHGAERTQDVWRYDRPGLIYVTNGNLLQVLPPLHPFYRLSRRFHVHS